MALSNFDTRIMKVVQATYHQGDINRITDEAYLVSITKNVSDCQQIGTGALLVINNYISGLLWGNQCFFLFDSHSKDEIERMSATGAAVLLKFDLLQSLENYIKSVYYLNYPMSFYFQVQFLKLKCTENTKNTIKSALKSKRKKKVASLKKNIKGQSRKYNELKRDIIDPESR